MTSTPSMPDLDHALRMRRARSRASRVLAVLALVALLSLLVSAAVGSVHLGVDEVVLAARELLRGDATSVSATLLELRLTRALAAFVTGASLALAGALMQALLRNPLADPYVLGVSSGAAAGALGAMLAGAAIWLVDLAAFGGALAISLALFVLAHRDLRQALPTGLHATSLLLTGVILAAGCGALITLMLAIAPEGRLRGMVFWLIGDLSGAALRPFPWLVLAAVLAWSLYAARSINLLAQLAEQALTLGVRVASLRQRLFVGAALLAASAVTTAGSIGFVGLIVPHACRFALGPDHRLLLPAAALGGGAFLVIADTMARSVVAPQQLPVGVITALIGVPVFLMQLHHVRRR